EFRRVLFRSCKLAGGVQIIFHLNNGAIRLYNTKVNNRIYLHGNVICGDNVLRWYVHRYDTKVDPNNLLQYWNDNDQAWSFNFGKPAQGENYRPFIFAHDFNGTE